MTVHVYNPHVNIQDLTTFLRRNCTVTKEPSRNLDSDGIWDGKWTFMVKLKEDPEVPDGIHHPPSSSPEGVTRASSTTPGSPNCATSAVNWATPLKIVQCKCAKTVKGKDTQPGHAKKKPHATSAGLRATVSRTARKEQSTMPRRPNLLGEQHKRRLPQPAFQSQSPERPRKLGGEKAPGRSKPKPDQGSTQALEPRSTEQEMPAIPESGPTDSAPQPASEIQEEGPWMKQEHRKRRHSPPKATKKTKKKHLSNHNPYSDPEVSEEEEQPENEGPDDQLDQVTKVLQEMRVPASVMEASPPPSAATVEQEEASMEEKEQN
ncbi:hypothetical protein NDU88_002187 [Pleurodeles waltl]|uniref:Zinc finger CCHC domain-containing protein n=1 Tax=Pleurodeles waltl TaxID=8319 RepID=A0AAV7NFQ6_PLEWA|nr:hypothetical protein NDU88_002187 [Pleurodeles waltl]